MDTHLYSHGLSNIEQYHKISMFYENNSIDRFNKHWVYINFGSTQERICNYIQAGGFIFGKAIIGQKVGSYIGENTSKIYSIDETIQGIGKFFGGVIGSIGGGSLGLYNYISFQEDSSQFKKWKKLALQNSINESIIIEFSCDPILKNFICPVSFCIMETPVYTPNGKFYDMLFILNCEKDINGFIKDPLRNEPFQGKDLLLDFEKSIVINKRIQFRLKNNLRDNNKEVSLQEILKNIIDEKYKKIKSEYEICREFIEIKRKQKLITIEEYREEIRFFECIFGESYEDDLNWDLDWEKILSERWEKNLPMIKKLKKIHDDLENDQEINVFSNVFNLLKYPCFRES